MNSLILIFCLFLFLIKISFLNAQISCSSQSDCDSPKYYCVTIGLFPTGSCMPASKFNHMCSDLVKNDIYIGHPPCDSGLECKLSDLLGFNTCHH